MAGAQRPPHSFDDGKLVSRAQQHDRITNATLLSAPKILRFFALKR